MSLRLRVLVGMGFIAVVLGLIGLRTVRTTEAGLVAQVHAMLARSAPRLRVVEPPPGGQVASPLWVAVVVDDQLRVVLEPDLTRDDPGVPDLDVATVRARADGPPFTVGAVGADLRYRVQVRTDGRQGRIVVYAAPLEDVDDAVRRVRRSEIRGFRAVIGTLGLVAFWVVRLGLRPVRQMTATATAIADGDRSRRIPDATPGTEAAELGAALNHMLTRIDEDVTARAASEARLRQFVADASHELRTPLTTIQGYAELYRLGGLGDHDQLDEAMRRTEQEAHRMADLVDDLLNLARLDQGRPLDLGPVDLAAVLRDAARDAAAVEPHRPVDVEAPDPLVVQADEARIRQVVANLVGNVRMHTAPDVAVHLRLRRDGDWAVVEVADEGPGMDHETAARAFERFYRSDTARTRATGGAGLGLAIVAAVVAAHQGHVRITATPGGGTTVQVALPLAPVSGPVADPPSGPVADPPA